MWPDPFFLKTYPEPAAHELTSGSLGLGKENIFTQALFYYTHCDAFSSLNRKAKFPDFVALIPPCPREAILSDQLAVVSYWQSSQQTSLILFLMLGSLEQQKKKIVCVGSLVCTAHLWSMLPSRGPCGWLFQKLECSCTAAREDGSAAYSALEVMCILVMGSW